MNGILNGGVLVVIVVVLRGWAADNLRWNPAERQRCRGVEKAVQKRGCGVGVVAGGGVGDTTMPDRTAVVFVQESL